MVSVHRNSVDTKHFGQARDSIGLHCCTCLLLPAWGNTPLVDIGRIIGESWCARHGGAREPQEEEKKADSRSHSGAIGISSAVGHDRKLPLKARGSKWGEGWRYRSKAAGCWMRELCQVKSRGQEGVVGPGSPHHRGPPTDVCIFCPSLIWSAKQVNLVVKAGTHWLW